MLNVPVQVYIAIMMLHEDPLEDVQSLFCEMVKNEEQEERTFTCFPACRSCEALDLCLACHTMIIYTVVDYQICDQYILEGGKGKE